MPGNLPGAFMRTHLYAFSCALFLAGAIVAAPDLALARGCGGGHGGESSGPQGEGGHHGRPGRRNRGGEGSRGGHHGGPDGAYDGPHGPRHGHPGRRGRRGHGGPNVDVTIGGYGYPGGRIGPATPACYELARLRGDLDELWRLRQQVNSGKRFVETYGANQHRVVTARQYRAMLDAFYGSGGQGGPSTLDEDFQGAAGYQRALNNARDESLVIVDGRIEATQARIHDLEYECAE
jgi:hypothetical protein